MNTVILGVDPGLLTGLCLFDLRPNHSWDVIGMTTIHITTKRLSWQDDVARAIQWTNEMYAYIAKIPSSTHICVAMERPGGHDNLFTARWFGIYEGVMIGLSTSLTHVKYIPVLTADVHKYIGYNKNVVLTSTARALRRSKQAAIAYALGILAEPYATKLKTAKRSHKEAMADAFVIGLTAIHTHLLPCLSTTSMN